MIDFLVVMSLVTIIPIIGKLGGIENIYTKTNLISVFKVEIII